MKTTTLLISLPVIAAGPIVTVYLLLVAKGDGAGVSLAMIVGVLIMSAVAAAVSTVTHLIMKGELFATVVSVPISEILYVLLMWAYIYCMPEGRERAESFMWLPIVISLLFIYAFPTACSVSYGTGMIVRGLRDFGESKSDASDSPKGL